MKKLIFLILLASNIFAQQIDRIDTLIFVTGAGDTTAWFQLNGKYAFVYITVDDTGATYTDSIKAWNITKRLVKTDSVISAIDLWGRSGTTSNSWFTATSNAGAITKYWVYDAYIDRLYLTWANATFVNGKRVKITIMAIKR